MASDGKSRNPGTAWVSIVNQHLFSSLIMEQLRISEVYEQKLRGGSPTTQRILCVSSGVSCLTSYAFPVPVSSNHKKTKTTIIK